ncbi:MAG: alanine--tRNA ligase [Rhizobiales bacterium]|nr:alanine--tRNA ligase [Hyphomicrobiales bacterium]
MASVSDIRSTFLGYFGRHEHAIVPSSPLVPRNDPTLMFTTAGMVQFKNIFTGLETRSYRRAATAQKCVRAGGKHNDLDNVGYTARHHTFFEMLGNFSFGDYFKEEAITLAWNLVTREYGLPKEKLLVTVYHTDDEAFGFWKKIAGLSDDRIIRISTSDNFWAMGDTGPCGPCSEIFFDHGPSIAGGPPGSDEADGDRFIEIWNLVFMQFEQMADGTRLNLPRPSIDTGMGLERISAVLQGTHDNYRIDIMRNLILAVAQATGVDPDGAQSASHRVIADHLRASAFLVADGVLPSNEGRGYVLRRIMRRGMRHAHMLGAKEPLMHKLVPVLVRDMGQAYPELLRAEALITETLKLEETRFRNTLERGIGLLEAEVSKLGDGQVFSGETAFRLYDTFGFPLDLTQDALRARRISVDVEAFNAAMARQKAEARAHWSGSGEAANEAIWFQVRDQVGATEFLGYGTEEAEGVVTAIVASGRSVDSGQGELALTLNQSPFYAESGGQVGDQGMIIGDGFRFRVQDTLKRAGDVIVHLGQVEDGAVAVGKPAFLRVDHARRSAIRANHSATHLLHEALRQVLGDHVAQKGSLVEPERLRFDISHPKPISTEELERVEDITNAIILRNEPVETRLMAVDDAIASGARALFGEKYGDEVRVVSMGTVDQADGSTKPYSIELCGGTHAGRTGDIGLVAVLGEGAVSAGVRRIEAMTGTAARRYLNEQAKRLRQVAQALRAGVDEVADRASQLADERRKLDRDLSEARRKLAMGGGGGEQADTVEKLGAVSFVGRQVEGIEAKDLKGLVDQQKSKIGAGVVALGVVGADGRAGLVVGVTADLSARISAVDLVRIGSECLGGKGGGGRPDMAQAGGPDGSRMGEALAAIRARVAEMA